MFEGLIITLREGIEAALVVGIAVAYLNKTGREDLKRNVYWGLLAALVASVAGAVLLHRLTISEEAFEGFAMLIAAVFVGSMMAWMWRTASRRKGAIENRVEAITASGQGGLAGSGLGLFLFTFFMVFREGVETVIFLGAIGLSTKGVFIVFGALVGLVFAIAFGISFVKGSLRIDLKRFFQVTSMVLFIFVIQLLINSYHELSEAGILPTSEQQMAVLGPIVRNNLFFVLAIVALPVIVLVVPGRLLRSPEPEPITAALRRQRLAQIKKQRLWRTLTAVTACLVLLALGLDYVYSMVGQSLSPPILVTAQEGQIRIPITQVNDGQLHRFGYQLEDRLVRFLLIRIHADQIGSAFDACQICGDHGYFQDDTEIVCANCMAAIYTPTIGKGGGCNPIKLASRMENDQIVIAVDDLAEGAVFFRMPGNRATGKVISIDN